MATLFKVQKKHAAKIEAKERKESTNVNEKTELKRPREEDEEMGDVDMSGPPKKRRNKQRVLMLCSRGATHRMRHLMNDLEVLLPQVKKESKFDAKNKLHMLSELSYLHNCNNTLFFEARRHEDLYMWAVKSPNGPSIRMHVQNIHTMDELKMMGNCLRGSRGIVSFDSAFDQSEWGRLTKEVFTHIFAVPPSARRAKPFIDHVLTFSTLDGKIWFRNFQIVEKDPLQPSGPPQTSLVEIGPRFVLTPIRIFEGAFNGATVYSNPEYVSPSALRQAQRNAKGTKYKARKAVEHERATRKENQKLEEDELAVRKVFA